MPDIILLADATGAFADVDARKLLHTSDQWTLGALPKGMQSGRTSIVLAIRDRQTGVKMAENSLQNLINAASFFASAYRDEVGRPGFARVGEPVRSAIKGRIETRIIDELGGDVALADRVAEAVMVALETDDEADGR